MNTPPRACNSATALTSIHILAMNEATATVLQLTDKDKARFWAKVNKDGPTMPHMDTPCWVWIGGSNRYGYGHFWAGGKTLFSHRVSWMIANGSIPVGEGYHGTCVCHICDNTACCRDDHLFLGTSADNTHDMLAKGRHKPLFGDKNGSRIHRERIARGDRHHSRLRPECVVRGDRHGSRLHPERVARGEQSGGAKLTDAKVLQIRTDYAAGGITQKQLGSLHGVTQSLVAQIVRRKIWRHIP